MKSSYICGMKLILIRAKKVAQNNSIIFPTKEAHLNHIESVRSEYDKIFTNEQAFINAIKEAHDVWVNSNEACILNVSHINNIAYLIHKTDAPLLLPFDIDIKSIQGYEPTHNDMVAYMSTLKSLFGNSLLFAYISKSGKGIHFALNVDKEAFSSIETFNEYLYSLETTICGAFFGFLFDTIDTERVFDRSLYNITEKGVSYKNLTISINTGYAPYFNEGKTVPYKAKTINNINTVGKHDIVDKKYIAVEVKDNTPIASKTITNQSVNELIQTNEGRLILARYVTSGCISIERIESVIEPSRKNSERVRELKATVKNAMQKGIKLSGAKYEKTETYELVLKNNIKQSYEALKTIGTSNYIFPSDYLEAVKGAKTVFVVSENTGAGKTTTLLNAYKSSCLYIVPNVSVLEQLEATMHLTVLHSQKQTTETFYKTSGRVGITYAYFYELISNNESFFLNYISNTFNAIIFDEVDYVTQSIMLQIEKATQYVNHINPASQVVFCTATPFKCSLIYDLCEKRVKFHSGNNLKRNITFYKTKNDVKSNKTLAIVKAFLNKNNGATNIVYLNNRRLCKRIKDTLKEFEIMLYNSEVKEIDLGNAFGNMLVTSSITAGLNIYVKDNTKPVNFLLLGNDLTNSLIKQITGRVRNVNEVNVYLEYNETHKETANNDVRYIFESKQFCDLQISNINKLTNINSLIDFVQRKYVYYVNEIAIPLSISFFWNKTLDKYNCEVFKVLNDKNFVYNDTIFEVGKTKDKLVAQDVEEFNDLDKINDESDKEYGKLNGLFTQNSITYNIDIPNEIQQAISVLAILSTFFDKQKQALSVFKGLFYTFIGSFDIILDCFKNPISGINNEITLSKLVEYNVISNAVANALTKNKKYKNLYKQLFSITHTRKGNVLTFKHSNVASVFQVFLDNFIEVASSTLSKKDIESLDLFIQKNKGNSKVKEYIIKDLETYLNTIKAQKEGACDFI